jgi:protein phosphatase
MTDMIKISRIHSLLKQGKRNKIEDYIFPSDITHKTSNRIFIVCDGVGGEAKGEEASKLVAETFGEMLSSMNQVSQEDILAILEVAVVKIQDYITTNPEASNMSTTLTLASINNDGILLAWCGDSKIIHFNKKHIKWKSLDHSFIQHLININEISPEEALNHPQRNLITRCINKNTNPKDIDFHVIKDIAPGDYLMLATDGIFEQLSIDFLPNIASDTHTDKSDLIEQHCANKTRDNYSMYLLAFDNNSKSKSLKLLLVLGFSLFCGISIFWQHHKDSSKKIWLSDTTQKYKTPAQLPIINSKNADSSKK